MAIDNADYVRKVGMSPGILVKDDKKHNEKTSITILEYSKEGYSKIEIQNIDEIRSYKNNNKVCWINVCGYSDVEMILELAKKFGIGNLLLEDIFLSDQRPKIEEYDDFTFLVLKVLANKKENNRIKARQISFILGKDYVISFTEKGKDYFHVISERIISGRGNVRNAGADYLLYALLDVIIDNYFILLESFVEHLEKLEGSLLNNPTSDTLKSIMILKGI